MAVCSFGPVSTVPSVAGLTVHSTGRPRNEGESRAFKNTLLPGVRVTPDSDSSIPASSETERIRIRPTASIEGSCLSVAMTATSPGPTAVTRPLSSTVANELSEVFHVTWESPGVPVS